MRRAILITAALLLATWLGELPGTAWGEGEQAAQRGREGSEGQSLYLVFLDEQADLSPAYRIRDWEARGYFVLSALRDVAQRTQPAVLHSLEGLQGAGHVSEVHPHYLANLIVVQGDAEAARAMAQIAGVAGVYVAPWIEPVLPVSVRPASSAARAVEWNIQRIGADQVWTTYGVTGVGLVVANIDSGVEYIHPALVEQYRGNLGGGVFDHDYNWWDPSDQYDYPAPISGPYPLGSSHGTHTMGFAVGDDGGSNQIGVAPGARWIAAYGFCGWDCFLSAGEWMIAPWQVDDFDPGHPTADPSKRPHVVSNSWGAPGGLLLFHPFIEAWRAAGIFPVFAAANNGSSCGTMLSPADNPGAFGVGATGLTDEIAFFSSRGPNSLEPWLGLYGTGPDLSAPGHLCRTSDPGGGYSIGSGTSYATPHVAGTVALLWSAEPDLVGRVAETEAILRGTALPKTSDQTCGGVPGGRVPNNTYGWGRLDALAAVEMMWQAGTLAGMVTDASSGMPVEGAQVRMARDGHVLVSASGEAGVCDFPLGQGTYDVAVEAYGYAPWTAAGVEVTQDATTTLDVALTPLMTYTLSGAVTEGGVQATGDPVWGQVGVRDTPILETTGPATGFYSTPIAEGSYGMRAAGRGYVAENRPITVTGDLVEDFSLASRWTYYVRDSRSACGPSFDWIDATDGTPHSVSFMSYFPLYEPGLPAFTFYDSEHVIYYVSSNGLISFGQGYPVWIQDAPQLVIPFEGPSNDAIYGFVDAFDPANGDQGTVYHKVVDDRYLVVEYHQVEHWPSGDPETFEFIFDTETGVVKLQYLEVRRPDWATVGVEDREGIDGVLYSYHNSAQITDGLAVEFYPVFGPPPADQDGMGVTGTLSGTVYVTGTTNPIPGAWVTATSFLTGSVATTDANGHYLFADVCADLYTLQAGATGYYPGDTVPARVRWPGDVVETDLFLEPMAPEPSLTKSVSPDRVLAGELLTYTLAYANGGAALWGAILSDTLPWQVEYLTSTPPADHQDGTLVWTIDIATGGQGEVTVIGVLSATVVSSTTVTNTAWLRWDGSAIAAGASFHVRWPSANGLYLPVVLRASP